MYISANFAGDHPKTLEIAKVAQMKKRITMGERELRRGGTFVSLWLSAKLAIFRSHANMGMLLSATKGTFVSLWL